MAGTSLDRHRLLSCSQRALQLSVRYAMEFRRAAERYCALGRPSDTFRKGRAIAGPQHPLAAIFDERQFAFEDVHEFVFVRMPVALARPIARRHAREIDPEIREPAGIAQPLPHTFGAGRVELQRIARAFAFLYGGDVDLGYGQPSL
jgi:hypothetical protein